ncbi:YjbH domain-containing protein [Gammaproteobacteria bacterium]|nr:YjbH domain-containing protein [Gammaproteobacteria bacterium]
MSKEDNSISKSYNTYGSVGLLQTPTANFSDDGEFAFGLSFEDPYSRLYSQMQFFPWLEVVVRYTEAKQIPYQPTIDQTWKDKGMDFKFRLLKESDRIPALAIGFQDIGGTGSYASEYLVATKRQNNFNISLGLGWGRLAGEKHISNPLGWINSNNDQTGSIRKDSGKINLDNFFNDDYASFFGGIEYFTPVDDLSFKIEYDSTDYGDLEGKYPRYNQQIGEKMNVDSRFNYGLNYKLNIGNYDDLDISVGYLRGNTVYAGVTAHTNLNERRPTKFIAPKEIINIPYLEPFNKLNDGWKKYLSDLIMWQMGNVGFVTHNLIFKDNELQVEISQGRFRDPVQAIDLASRILANNSPKNIEYLTVINIDQGIETLRATIPRESLVESASQGPLDAERLIFNERSNFEVDAITAQNEYLYPNFYWQLKPNMNGTLQHQIKFYFWQLEALFHAEYSIKKGLYLTTDIGLNIDNNFEDYNYHVPDGELHHVRQDRRLYLTEGESGIRRLALDYLHEFTPNIKAKFSAGYLEWMYGGFGGELIYMPQDKNWALGLDTYWVKQREYDQMFSFRDYETVTGFLSAYYNLPFYDLRFVAKAGKFLGKDVGVNFEVSRRFESGARVGASASFTDCDKECVGEGSFNKWIYFTLPMDMFYIRSDTRSTATYGWSPLTKDAGTRIEPSNLYHIMSNAKDEVEELQREQWSIKKIFAGFSTKPKEN